ncbi:hypothetical protein [Actinomadura rupiterrae]|uniref:hypothetical protein n=1 Tax=Actinomadura rupiterrae TaxID=559627 RepID=UPI0020A44184|nr:hypothetical protein [Actinomadura rupiterrae]MCP2337495.1 hypothetical protein [Actinomadura rupiterrae]
MDKSIGGLLNSRIQNAPKDADEVARRIGATPVSAPVHAAEREPEPEPEENGAAPAYVYVPTRSYDDSGERAQEVRLELRRLADGEPGLAVFTDSHILLQELGPGQPYAKVSVFELMLHMCEAKIRVVANPTLEAGMEKSEKDATDGRRNP